MLNTMSTIIFFFIISTAQAGLKDGIRGKTWGQILYAQEMPECEMKSAAGEPGFVCTEEVSGVEGVTVSYSVHPVEGLYSIFMVAKGYSACSTLREVIGEAWGRGYASNQYLTKTMDPWSWNEGGVIGSFKYNPYIDECSILAMHSKKYDKKKKEDKEQAKKASSSL